MNASDLFIVIMAKSMFRDGIKSTSLFRTSTTNRDIAAMTNAWATYLDKQGRLHPLVLSS